MVLRPYECVTLRMKIYFYFYDRFRKESPKTVSICVRHVKLNLAHELKRQAANYFNKTNSSNCTPANYVA